MILMIMLFSINVSMKGALIMECSDVFPVWRVCQIMRHTDSHSAPRERPTSSRGTPGSGGSVDGGGVPGTPGTGKGDHNNDGHSDNGKGNRK